MSVLELRSLSPVFGGPAKAWASEGEMRNGMTLALRLLSVAWVVQAVPWSFRWLANAGPSGLWSVLRAGEFHWVVTGHVLLGVCSALSPILLWSRRDVGGAFVLIGAAVSCLCLVGIMSREMFWPMFPRVALSFLTLVVVLLHALARGNAGNGEPA
jgi:hypothetical protein